MTTVLPQPRRHSVVLRSLIALAGFLVLIGLGTWQVRRLALKEALIATVTAFLVTSTGRSAWFVGALTLAVYVIFAMTLYLLPPAGLSNS